MSRTQPRGDGTDADDESLNVEPPPASSRQSSRGPYQRSDSFVAKQDLIDQLAAKDYRLRSIELVARKNEDETAKALEDVKKLRERNAALERAFASAADTVVERTTPPPSEPSSETHVSNRIREAFNLTPDTPAGGHLKSGEARTADATKPSSAGTIGKLARASSSTTASRSRRSWTCRCVADHQETKSPR